MQLEIEKHNFYKLENVTNLKNFLGKTKDVRIEDSLAKGNVEINISYLDHEGLECFKAIEFEFELDLQELKILEVTMGKINKFLVENQGLDINYQLIINYLEKEDNIVIEKIDIDSENEKIKEDMQEYYEDQLLNNLSREIISTHNNDETNFLNFFDTAGYSKIKCIYVDNSLELEKIAEDYNISIDKLKSGYDEANHKVIFYID